ncbi:hypothetical protein WSM22_10110 [Cytophagales bacterium WSM2-2]|nr:hypothetical protein WSM22_10110 [Cytophagales bacterium WSM2-2]
MSNIWTTIPLEDYERHMSHETVGQLDLLNRLTQKYYQLLKPKSILFAGVSGGNGLEYIDGSVTDEVVGIDINQEYLGETSKRYSKKIPGLRLLSIDILDRKGIMKANFIWAALVLEYTGVVPFFEFALNNVASRADLIISIQSNNGVQSVSATGVDSVKSLGEIFQLVEPTELTNTATKFEFDQLNFEENFLPNGKSIKTFHFRKKA